MVKKNISSIVVLILLSLFAMTAFAGQGAVGTLYKLPNAAFVEQPSGETVVTVNDTSGSISGLQTAINQARSANSGKVIVIHLLKGATYSVSNTSLVIGSDECLVASGAIIRAANSSVAVPLISIASGTIKASVAGGTLDGNGANIQGIDAPSASRVNIDSLVVKNFGMNGILLNGTGNTTYDNEMTVTRCDVSGCLTAGIRIQNSTQTAVLDNQCHNNGVGISLSCAWANIANNKCLNNTTGIDIAGGDDNVVANNTCDNNGTGIHAGGSLGMIVSNSVGSNSTNGINSNGTSNNFIDDLFTSGNAANFTSGGTTNNVVAYQAALSASGQNYFYPPLINDQHTNSTIINGMGRTDLTLGSNTIATVQSQYNAARTANPNNVIVLHLNGTFTVGASPLLLSSNTCVLLNGTIQINSSTTASAAVTNSATGQTHISISGGTIDGGGLTGRNGISIYDASMVQVDGMTLQNFGAPATREGGSDVIHFSAGSSPYILTRNSVNGGAARGIWLQLSGQKSLVSDNQVTAVNQDGVDCDSSTYGSVVKFNDCHDLVRYGVFFEQSASHDLALGNICDNDGRDINVYNNYATYRAPTQYNNVICNSLMGNNGIRNGSTGDITTVSSHNFFFNNNVVNADIESQLYGTENYYSQTFQTGGALSTSGSESFFNSTDVNADTISATATATFTRTSTSTPTRTNTPVPPTFTFTRTFTATSTSTKTPTSTPTRTPTWTSTLTFTKTFTPSFTPTNSPTSTRTPTRTPTSTPTPCSPTTITPYLKANGGSWQSADSVTVVSGSSVALGPQPVTGGSWSWTGPSGFTSSSRQIDSIPLSLGINIFTAAYTNPGGCRSTETFTITVVSAPTDTPTPTNSPTTTPTFIPASYEAESASLSGTAAVAADSSASGGNKVRFIGNSTTNYVTFNNVTVTSTGNYQVTVDYMVSGTRSFDISVNGGAAIPLTVAGTDWAVPASAVVTLSLNTGTNSLKFFNNTAYAPDLDRITVSRPLSAAKPAFVLGPAGESLTPTPIAPRERAVPIRALPNISKGGAPIQFHVDLDQPGKIELTVFTVLGEKVFQTTVTGQAGDNVLGWNLQNQGSGAVASGLYLYMVQITGKGVGPRAYTGKVVVIH